jgi:hypothetical protein
MGLIRVFERGNTNIAKLNYEMIILISKKEEVRTLKKIQTYQYD